MKTSYIPIAIGIILILVGTLLYTDVIALPMDVAEPKKIYTYTSFSLHGNSIDKPSIVQKGDIIAIKSYSYGLWLTSSKEAMLLALQSFANDIETIANENGGVIGTIDSDCGYISEIRLDDISIQYYNYYDGAFGDFYTMKVRGRADDMLITQDKGQLLIFNFHIVNIPEIFMFEETCYAKVSVFESKLYINSEEIHNRNDAVVSYYDTNIDFKIEITNSEEIVIGAIVTIVDLNNIVITWKQFPDTTTNIWETSLSLPGLENYKYILGILTGGVEKVHYHYRGFLEPTGTITYELIIQESTGGTTYPSYGTHTYSKDQAVTVTATPDANYRFEYWIVDGFNEVYSNPILIGMTGLRTLKPVFTYEGADSVTLTITIQGGGSTKPYSSGTYTLKEGDSITLNATAFPGYTFSQYIINTQTVNTNPYTLTISQDTQITVIFQKTVIAQTIIYALFGSGGVLIAIGAVLSTQQKDIKTKMKF